MIPKTTAISKRMVASCAMITILTVVTVHPFFEFEVKSMELRLLNDCNAQNNGRPLETRKMTTNLIGKQKGMATNVREAHLIHLVI